MNHNPCRNLLRRANAALERFLACCSRQISLHPDEELGILLQVEQTVRAVGAELDRGLEPSDELVTRKELARYQANLVRLRHKLASMGVGVTGRRARLFARPKRVAVSCRVDVLSNFVN
jgi:hypothetical protein